MLQTRQSRIAHLQEHPEVEVLIIGAGINGIGTFRELALQDVEVLMVDQGDYCSGASAASSHMVHGGIRYLENGEFRLVREAINERNRLIENAPHLVKPLATTFPIFKWFSGLLNAPLKFLGLRNSPAERGAVVIKVGMTLYDIFSGKQTSVPKHIFRNRRVSLDLFPALNPQILFTGTYFDGSMLSPERIALELILDTVEENEHAIPLNYVEVVSIEDRTVALRDEVSGSIVKINPKIVVNAGGPWIDEINKTLGKKTEFIGGTKGSHLILDHPELREAIGENEFFFENQDGRIVLIFPMGDKVLVGTSDIRVDTADPSRITDEEVDYFIEMIRRVFPEIVINRSHIVFTFSGVRPLASCDTALTATISRDHEVKIIEAGDDIAFPIFSLVSGKWTTFRAFAEQISDIVLERLGKTRKLSTKDLLIGGSKGYPKEPAEKDDLIHSLRSKYELPNETVVLLFERYGMNLLQRLEAGERVYHQPLRSLPDYSIGEIEHILHNEEVVHLDDLILRRTILGKFGRTTPEGLSELGAVAQSVLGWTEDQAHQEIERFIDILRTRHRMDYDRFID